MTTKQILICIAAAVLAALLVALLCHAVGLNSHAFAVFPIGAGVAAFFVIRNQLLKRGWPKAGG